jgi:hypothetical protein
MSDTKQKQKHARAVTPPVAGTLPEAQDTQVLKLPKGKTKAEKKTDGGRRITCEPGVVYNMMLGDGTAAVKVPFTLPKSVTEPTQVVLASANPNWLGRDGQRLRAHVCVSDVGTVILQPHGKGWKANVYEPGRITLA